MFSFVLYFFAEKQSNCGAGEKNLISVTPNTHCRSCNHCGCFSYYPHPNPQKKIVVTEGVEAHCALFFLSENNKMHLAEGIGSCFFLLPNQADSNRDLDERKLAPESAAKLRCRNEREGVALVQGQVSGRGG